MTPPLPQTCHPKRKFSDVMERKLDGLESCSPTLPAQNAVRMGHPHFVVSPVKSNGRFFDAPAMGSESTILSGDQND